MRIVDQRHGYTVEFAPDPHCHRDEYDAAEAILARNPASSDDRVCESLQAEGYWPWGPRC